MEKVSVIIKGERSSLGEGRQFGLGFAFCAIIDGKLTTVQPPSTCKDYLNDVLAIERFYPELSISVYGLNYKKTKGVDVFDADGISHLFVQPLESRQAGNLKHYDLAQLRKDFRAKATKALLVIREFEERMGFKTCTKILETDQDGGLIFVVPNEWTTSTYMLSLYALMIRSGAEMNYDTPLNSFLGVPSLDSSMVAAVRQKIMHMLRTKELPKFNPQDYMNGDRVSNNVHNAGIMSWSIPNSPNYLGKHPITDEPIFAE